MTMPSKKRMTISKKAAASTLVCVAIALLLSCFALPAFATMPNCKVWGNQKAYTYGGITIAHKAGIESMSWSGSQNYITGWAYAKLIARLRKVRLALELSFMMVLGC